MLVRAAANESLVAREARSWRSIETLSSVCQELTAMEPPGGDGYGRIRKDARHALRIDATTLRRPTVDVREPPEPVTVWWCHGCGGLDAPQPCLGVCLWPSVEWVNLDLYEQTRARALATIEAADRLHSLIRRLALVTARPGAEEENLIAFRHEAARVVNALSRLQGLRALD